MGKFDDACSGLKQLFDLGYSPTDIITTLFQIIRKYDMVEYLKLEFMMVHVLSVLNMNRFQSFHVF